MASPSLPKRGRPKLGIEVHRIGLRMDVYNEWQVQKDLVGMAEKTHSEFASHLLQMCEEMRVRQNNQQCSTPKGKSTPSRLVRRSLLHEDIHLSPILADESEIDK
ncbi:Hypothetical predicted protein [Paramuricea clavata]|uniref:Uncharacterized protein n=1 Tax=Paramuricea clavata TaxID=317549 RepID=A0A6S7FKG7_PARCT|nr:Hypothetical predicted protein [Paramuricea clavata]